MGALHFLESEFKLMDANNKNVSHELELFENGGKLYLRLWLDNEESRREILCQMTQNQANELAEASECLSNRLQP